MDTIEETICILGAGPGGASAALSLAHAGINCLVLDKARFPREKTCGDAVNLAGLSYLESVAPGIFQEFKKKSEKLPVNGFKLFLFEKLFLNLAAEKQQEPFDGLGYVITRKEFDYFLFNEVKKRESIRIIEGVEISLISRTSEGWLLQDKSKTVSIYCKLLIDASGISSKVKRMYVEAEKKNSNYAGAVTRYYEGVKELDYSYNSIEIHVFKSCLPGYLWIFPMSNGGANVGLGIRSDYIKRNKIRLEKKLDELLTQSYLSKRFANASVKGKTKGFGLPLGPRTAKNSGDGFMLVGDASHLVNPLSGEGISTAIRSGVIAGKVAVECNKVGDFSRKNLRVYDQQLSIYDQDVRLQLLVQKLFKYPILVKIGAKVSKKFFFSNPKKLIKTIEKVNKLWRKISH